MDSPEFDHPIKSESLGTPRALPIAASFDGDVKDDWLFDWVASVSRALHHVPIHHHHRQTFPLFGFEFHWKVRSP